MVEYRENALTAQDFFRLKLATKFHEPNIPQVELALKRGLYNIAAAADGQVVGMGRLVGDGVMYWYIQDVNVDPAYQGRGIGKAIVLRLIEYVNQHALPGQRTTIGLMAAKGKDGFYEKLGFTARPNDSRGPGMTMIFTAPGGEK